MTCRYHPVPKTFIAGGVALLIFAATATAGATVETSAVDQISQAYEVPITNHADDVTLSSTVTVTSATLDTLNPDGSGVSAPPGQIYLSLQVASSPPQVSSSNPSRGHFFSSMTPVPGSAWRYVASSGRRFEATRVNAIDQANSLYSSTDDGMVDATYYFTIPISTRAGTIKLLPNRTLGVEFTNFVGGASAVLTVGGPTRIPVRFPKSLTVTTTTTTTTTTTIPFTAPLSGSSNNSTLVIVLLVIMLLAVGTFEVRRQRRLLMRRRTAANGPQVQHPSSTDPSPTTPRSQTTLPDRVVVNVTSSPAENQPEQKSNLRVNLLGPLSISPTLTTPSDPVRAIVAYLAMNPERALTMEEIQNAVWPLTSGGTDIKRPVMRNYMSDVRRCVGESHLPSAAGKPGYQLVNVITDWGELQHLVAQSTKLSKPDATKLKLAALALVKGPPFTADTSRYFTWAFSSSVVYKMISTVTELAHDVSSQLVMAGDLKGAESALRQGLQIEPTALTLWEDLTDVLLETHDQSLMAVHWTAAALVLRPEDVSQLRTRENG